MSIRMETEKLGVNGVVLNGAAAGQTEVNDQLRGYGNGRRGLLFVPVEENVKAQLDTVLKPETLKQGGPADTRVMDLPAGYQVVVQIFKDDRFMNEVRFKGQRAINAYLKSNHPEIVAFLEAHRMRISSTVIVESQTQTNSNVVAAVVAEGSGYEVLAKSTCTCATATAVSSILSTAVAGIVADAEAASTAVASGGATAVVCCCVSTEGKGPEKPEPEPEPEPDPEPEPEPDPAPQPKKTT